MNTQSENGRKLFFYFCLQHFASENILKNHTEVCLKINGTQKVKMPCKNKNIFFMKYHKQLMAPYVIYADFECITVPTKEEYGKQTVAYQMLNHVIYVTKSSKKGDVPVRDHCHVTGKYRGSAHTK